MPDTIDNITAVEHITQVSTSKSDWLCDAFQTAFHDAAAGRGLMDPRIYDIKGFCGRKFRLFLNNLTRELDGKARYLEVGVFAGATLCPVINDNVVEATGIDNYSWDQGQQIANTLYRNIAEFKKANSLVTLIEKNFLDVPQVFPHKFNIYFYDGDHAEKSQYDGIMWSAPMLEDSAIILVDDWNWRQVRTGTMNALRDLNVRIDYMLELRTTFGNEMPKPAYGGSDWHNGWFGAVVSKR